MAEGLQKLNFTIVDILLWLKFAILRFIAVRSIQYFKVCLMPFYPEFKRQFVAGDLVYGLFEQRGVYANKYKEFFASKTPMNISTIDQYAISDAERDMLERKRIMPTNQAEFSEFTSRHHKYHSILSSKFIRFEDRYIYNDDVLKRKCKSGLGWMVDSKMTVHFILDGINMTEVVNKSNIQDKRGCTSGGSTLRSITGAELRWIYRNRNDINVQRRVQFWNKGQPVSPPWFGVGKELWDQYEPRSDPDMSTVLSLLFGHN
ncbi:hypothetical protein KCX83_06470 [Brucella oryzae]|uniref:hypothetical protein n=1 Tax=Brucella oryzae TaxID=335286 RepID=UPI001B82615C|nr:hypothetical protein [Brucella oryzae]MBR7651966.1 hypothetical protein [Brucella oryzae]